MTDKILIVNGPNLNMLGKREPEIYGAETLPQVEEKSRRAAEELGLEIDWFQSNVEGELVSKIQTAIQGYAGVIINAGAYTHTSVAIMDALLSLKVPIIEVHLSNIFKRESFRHHSYVSLAASGVICGLGSEGYVLALRALASLRA